MAPRKRKGSGKFLSGEEVQIWRRSRNLTLSEVGEWLGLTAQAVHKYELRGATKITALALSAIDRGLRPWKPNDHDVEAAQPVKDYLNERRGS